MACLVRTAFLLGCLVAACFGESSCDASVEKTVGCTASEKYHACASKYFPDDEDVVPATTLDPDVCVCLMEPLQCMLSAELCGAQAACERTALLLGCPKDWCSVQLTVTRAVYETVYNFTGSYNHAALEDLLRVDLDSIVPLEWLAIVSTKEGLLIASVTIPASTAWNKRWEQRLATRLVGIADEAGAKAASGVIGARVRYYTPE